MKLKLSNLTIESIKEFISGDNSFTPYLSGPNIIKLFNKLGIRDAYGRWGMPDGLSRNAYVEEKLREINGTEEMRKLLEIVFDPRHFALDSSKDIKTAVEKINPLISQDGYRLKNSDGRYKVIYLKPNVKLAALTIKSIRGFISGDNDLTPRLSGEDIVELFGMVGIIDDSLLDSLRGRLEPRQIWQIQDDYVREKLHEINGTEGMRKLLEIVFDPRHFALDSSKDIKTAVEKINPLISHDGYRLENSNGRYKVIGADLPEKIEVEVHFEEIQTQIIEQIRNAKFLIWVAVAWFTDIELARELYQKKKEGLNVRIVISDDEINEQHGFSYEKFSDFKRIPKVGVYENIMHHKFCVIDLKTVIHGSYNWTKKSKWNKETITIEQNRELAEEFASKFVELMK